MGGINKAGVAYQLAFFGFIYNSYMIMIPNKNKSQTPDIRHKVRSTMTEIIKKEICKCTNCGNEAEMMVTCSLEDAPQTTAASPSPPDSEKPQEGKKVKGVATCSHCGNEADMWVEL